MIETVYDQKLQQFHCLDNNIRVARFRLRTRRSQWCRKNHINKTPGKGIPTRLGKSSLMVNRFMKTSN